MPRGTKSEPELNHLAAKIRPTDPQVLQRKALRLATWPDEAFRDGQTAIGIAKQAIELAEANSNASASLRQMITLGAAHAAAGDFDQGAAVVQEVYEMMYPQGPKTRIDEYFGRYAKLFKSKQILIWRNHALVGRIFLDAKGETAFQAKLISLDGDTTTLQKLDGKTIEISLSELSVADREHIKQ